MNLQSTLIRMVAVWLPCGFHDKHSYTPSSLRVIFLLICKPEPSWRNSLLRYHLYLSGGWPSPEQDTRGGDKPSSTSIVVFDIVVFSGGSNCKQIQIEIIRANLEFAGVVENWFISFLVAEKKLRIDIIII